MNQIRSQLTKLKNKMASKLPDGLDLFGYPGVSKAGVMDCIERAYNLTARLENLRGQFPIIALKRKLQPLIDTCKRYMEEDLEGKKSTEKFDQFLINLTAIHDEISLTHTVYLSETLRTDSELEAVRLQTRGLHADYESFRPQVAELIEQTNTITGVSETMGESYSEAQSTLEAIQAIQTSIITTAAAATAKAEVITKYESETKGQKQMVVDLATRLNTTEKKLKALLTQSQDHVRQSEENLKKVGELELTNSKQQELIAQTLTLASKFGMAASFKERKDELNKPMWVWGAAFAVAMLGIFITGAFYIVPQFENLKEITSGGVLLKISLVAPLVWLGWMSAKQYGYLSRIREDYSFKYASALAFEGYKREAVSVDREMLRDLLSVATENMSLNPLRIYGDEESNHASPVHELVSGIFKRESKASSKPKTLPDE